MRSTILIAGTALAISASPALAGGSAGSMHGALGAGHKLVGTNSAGQCLCSTVGSALKGARVGALTKMGGGTGAIARMPRSASGGRILVNSVIGLNGVRAGQSGNRHGFGQAIGLAGKLDGASSMGSLHGNGHFGAGLAGTVTGNGTGLAGSGGHGRSLVNVSVANADGGKAGKLANVSVLNRTGTHGRSAVNVAALNGSGGSSGKIANVSVLSRTGTHGRSAVNVAALNGSGGTSGKIANVSVLNRTGTSGHSAVNIAALNGTGGKSGKVANVAVLNGTGTTGHSAVNVAALNGVGGFRIINGVPCLPDGTPLTGDAAKRVLAALTPSTPQVSSPNTGGGRARHSGRVRAASLEPGRNGKWLDSIPATGRPN